MQREEHAKLAQALLEASDRSFTSDERVQGSQELWGAATHAVLAVASNLDWKWEMEDLLEETIARLAVESGDLSLKVGLDAAIKFHDNFYVGEMTRNEIKTDRPKVHRFVNALLPMMNLSESKLG